MILLQPHKSLDRIEKEYGIKFEDRELEELADATVKAIREMKITPLAEKAEEIGKRKGLSGKELENFVADVTRTCMFYNLSLQLINNILSRAG